MAPWVESHFAHIKNTQHDFMCKNIENENQVILNSYSGPKKDEDGGLFVSVSLVFDRQT